MGRLDVDSLFTKIALEETIDICTNILFGNMEKIEGLSKTYLFIQKNPILVPESSTSNSIGLLWDHIYVRRWLMLFFYSLKRIGYKIVHLTLSLITTSGMLMISLFYFTKTFRSLPKFSKWSTC